VIGPDTYPEGVNPLTGLKVEDPSLLHRRPVIMKVSNHLIDYHPIGVFLQLISCFLTTLVGAVTVMPTLLRARFRQNWSSTLHQTGRWSSGHLYQAVIGSTGGDKEDVLPYIDAYIPGRYFVDKYLCPGVCDDGRNYVYSVYRQFCCPFELL
jgi:hypothetical protein